MVMSRMETERMKGKKGQEHKKIQVKVVDLGIKEKNDIGGKGSEGRNYDDRLNYGEGQPQKIHQKENPTFFPAT